MRAGMTSRNISWVKSILIYSIGSVHKKNTFLQFPKTIETQYSKLGQSPTGKIITIHGVYSLTIGLLEICVTGTFWSSWPLGSNYREMLCDQWPKSHICITLHTVVCKLWEMFRHQEILKVIGYCAWNILKFGFVSQAVDFFLKLLWPTDWEPWEVLGLPWAVFGRHFHGIVQYTITTLSYALNILPPNWTYKELENKIANKLSINLPSNIHKVMINDESTNFSYFFEPYHIQ